MKKLRNQKSKRNSIKRDYDNSSRAQKSSQSQTFIIEAYVELLAKSRGEEVPLKLLAEKTGVSERTIFRFFKDKETLHSEISRYIEGYLQASISQMEKLDFVGFAENTYKLFDQYESLATAYVLSPFGQKTRVILRKKLNELMIQRIVREYDLKLDEKKRKRLAILLSVVNAKVWYDIRMEFGFSGSEMSQEIAWMLKSLMDKIND